MQPNATTSPRRNALDFFAGCWAVYYYETGPIVRAVYASEVKALRAAANGGVGDSVAWIPWGVPIGVAVERGARLR